MEYINTFQDVYARLSGHQLTIGNDRIQRSWDMSGCLPDTGTLLDKRTGRQWLAPGLAGQFEALPKGQFAFFRQNITTGGMTVLGMDAKRDDDCGVAVPHLEVTVHLAFGAGKVDWVHIVYPSLPIHRSFLRVVELDAPVPEEWNSEWPEDYYDHLPLSPMHLRWKNVSFADKTDDNDNLVAETKGILTRRETRFFRGNLLMAEEIPSHEGIWMVKEGPSVVGSFTGDPDFQAKGMHLYTKGWGFRAEELRPGETRDTYGAAVIVWDGGEAGALKALHDYNRAVRCFVPERDALVMSNTWGDGNADGRICEEFLMNELRAAEELGVTYFQIDDGWEKGRTGNSVEADAAASPWGDGYYKANPNFWTVDEDRLPNSLTPIVEYARERGIAVGLWFSPDALNDYEGWERDADTLLKLHRTWGVTAFKMDGLIFRSKRGEENFGRLMRKVVKGSNGKVFFNLDTTASIRNGYFGRVQYGNLFLENRFTNPFGIWPNYWPHHTLRNLWLLSKYMPSERLQIEFLNVSNNTQYYDDPLSPANWGQEAAFAVSMFASPLAWMEMTALKPEARANLARVIHTYRPVQAEILAGQVLPIGDEPDGYSWTGLQSVTAEGKGFVLLFRENAGEESHTLRLWEVPAGRLILEPILGSGKQTEAVADEAGNVSFTLEHALQYALYRYKAVK